MSEERIQQLLKFHSEDPTDPFPLYALALEFLKTDKLKSLYYFRLLLKDHEGYAATYYHAAALMAASGFAEEAEITYRKGIQICQEQKEAHLLKELNNAYLNFQYSQEED